MSMVEIIKSITKEMYQQTRKETIVFISKSEGDIVRFLKYLQSKLEEQQKGIYSRQATQCLDSPQL